MGNNKYPYIIPLIPNINQTLVFTFQYQNQNKRLKLSLRYNDIGKYWFMDIYNPTTGEPFVLSIPIITGAVPSDNLLEQYAYLNLGCATVVPYSLDLKNKLPTFDNIGTEWALLWGDNSAIS